MDSCYLWSSTSWHKDILKMYFIYSLSISCMHAMHFLSYLPYPTISSRLLPSLIFSFINLLSLGWYVLGYRAICQSMGDLPGAASLKKTEYIKNNFLVLLCSVWLETQSSVIFPGVTWPFSVNLVLNSNVIPKLFCPTDILSVHASPTSLCPLSFDLRRCES